jgi:uncharacterized protein
MERRFVKGAEVRASGTDDKPSIEGYGAVFNQEYVLWDSSSLRIVETVKPGTFARALQEGQDVRCLFNHEPDNVLGRTKNSTLRLSEDTRGLHFDNDLDRRTTVAQNVRSFVDRKDVTGCSFSFYVTKQARTEEEVDGKTVIRREIQDVDLFDVGPVTYPAYEGTDVKARALELRAAGIPPRLLALAPELRDDGKDGEPEQEEACRCGCRACKSAECEECDMCMARCGDQSFCDHKATRSLRSSRDDGPPTKRVDSEDLTAGCFIYVGDAEKPATWALPWKFKSDAKIKSHLRNALARFNQTQKIPADKKAAAWKKLVGLCKKHGVQVSDEESKSWSLTAEQRVDLNGEGCECECKSCRDGNCAGCPDDKDGCGDEEKCGCQRSSDLKLEQAKARAHVLKISL